VPLAGESSVASPDVKKEEIISSAQRPVLL